MDAEPHEQRGLIGGISGLGHMPLCSWEEFHCLLMHKPLGSLISQCLSATALRVVLYLILGSGMPRDLQLFLAEDPRTDASLWLVRLSRIRRPAS